MVSNTDLRIAGGFWKMFLFLALLGIPFWFISLGWWGWFLAIPAFAIIYGTVAFKAYEHFVVSLHRQEQRRAAKQAQREAAESWLRRRH